MKSILLSLTVLSSLVIASPNVPPKDFKRNIIKQAGEKGPFARQEAFPKDYFLIPSNLPFLAGATLHHPQSSTLDLSAQQIEALMNIKQNTVPKVLKMAKKIKILELELAHEIGIKYQSKKAEELYTKVDEIAQLKTQLTKAHLKCIEKVKALLTPQQYEKVLAYLAVNK